MNLTDILDVAQVIPEMRSQNKRGVMEELCGPIVARRPDLQTEALMQVLIERERLGSTGIGDGVAIPHGKVPKLNELLVSFGRSTQGVDFDSLDGKPAHLFFLVLAPEDSAGAHLKVLARISRMLKSNTVREELMAADGSQEIYEVFARQEEEI